MIEISNKIIARGNSEFIRGLVVPITEEIEVLDVTSDIESYSFSDSEVTQNSTTELAGLVGIVTFITTWAATTALNEVYFSKIAPIIRAKIKGYLAGHSSTKKYAVTLYIVDKSTNKSLLVACVGNNYQEIVDCENSIPQAISLLESQFSYIPEGHVALVVLESDKLDLNYEVYSDYRHAIKSLEGMYPARLPKAFRNQ